MATSFRSGSRAVSPAISRRPKLGCGNCGRNSAPDGARRAARSTGMMVGRGEGQPAAGGPAHHIPVLLDEIVSALCVKEGGALPRRHLRRWRLYARLLARGARVIALDRDPQAIAAGQPSRSFGRAAASCRSALRRTRRGRRATRRSAARRRRARYRRLLHADRRSRARLFAAPRRAARHAHGEARAAPPPTSSPRTTKRRSPTSSIITAKSAHRAASPAPSSPTARRRPIVSTLQLAEMIARVAPAQARRTDPSGDAQLPGSAHRRQ